MPRYAPYGTPPDPRPLKGTPEAIVLEELERLAALREQTAANASPATVAEPEIQPSTEAPVQDPNPPQTSKEKQSMPATPSTHAKAALRNSKPRRRSKPQIAASDPALERHSRKCKICSHPDREAIEELFVNWHSPQSIRRDYAMHHSFDWSAVYRHARATGLFEKRRQNLRAVFDLILERSSEVAPTAHGIVAVVRAYTCLTEKNTWVEPEKRVHIVNEVRRHDSPAAAGSRAHLDLPADAGLPVSPHSRDVSAISTPANSGDSAGDAGHPQPSSRTPSRSSPAARRPAYVGSPLTTDHWPLSSTNRQLSKLGSPPTRS